MPTRSADRKWLVASGWWLADEGVGRDSLFFVCVVPPLSGQNWVPPKTHRACALTGEMNPPYALRPHAASRRTAHSRGD